MKNWSRLILPIVLGIIAGIMHYQILARETKLHRYVKIVRDVKRGDEITPDCVGFFELRGDMKPRQKTLTPWSEAGVYIHTFASHDLHAGDPLYYHDSARNGIELNSEQRKKLTTITVNLPKDLVDKSNDLNDLRVGAFLEFRVRDEKQNKTGDSEFKKHANQLEPLQIIRAGSTSADRKYNPYWVELAVPCDPITHKSLEWVNWLHADLVDRTRCRFVRAILVQKPGANASARVEEQADDSVQDNDES